MNIQKVSIKIFTDILTKTALKYRILLRKGARERNKQNEEVVR